MLLLLFSCHHPDEPLTVGLALTVPAPGVTDAVAHLRSGTAAAASRLVVTRDGTPVFSLDGSTVTDTAFTIDSLLPHHTYSLKAVRISSQGDVMETSAPASVTTLDTTSHQINWEMTYFGGQAGSCTLYDVAIASDSVALAVGEIYLGNSATGGGSGVRSSSRNVQR